MPRLDQLEAADRLDVGIAQLLRSAMKALTEFPLAQAAYKVIRPELESEITRKYGPNSRVGRKAKVARRQIRRKLEQAAKVQGEIERRLQEEL